MNFFHGLRGKLILTYTLVTVLALMALEVMVLSIGLFFSLANRTDERQYLNDVIYTLYPRASEHLQPGDEDLPGLQEWLEDVARSGYASLPPQNVFDSAAAAIDQADPMLVLSPEGTVLAQVPLEPGGPVGRRATADETAAYQRAIDAAMAGELDPMALSTRTDQGKTRLAVPIFEAGRFSDVTGGLLLTIEPPPPIILSSLLVYLGWIVGTGLLLLIAVTPFGALFGFIMSRGLSRRLTALTRAADAWSEGDFQPLPVDRSRDEIGVLAMRMRHMAERIRNLLHTQQELAFLEERNRLARELHDTVKQQSFATYMQIRAARNLLSSDPAAAEQHLQEAENLVKTSQQELGLLITELRPAALEGQGLTGALREYLKSWYEHTRIPAELKVTGERRLPLAIEQALFRVAQEALSNAARHSRASAVTLQLAIQPDQVRLEISDNGVGFDPSSAAGRGFGLESMRTRMAELGGGLEIDSSPEEGARVCVTAPIQDPRGLTHGN